MVIETQSPIAELLAKHPVLLAKVVNDLQLALVHPSGNGNQQKTEWVENFFGVSKSIIASTEQWWNHRRLIQIQFSDHTGLPILYQNFFQPLYVIENQLAERGGFEPPVEFLTLRRFSKPLLSTTQPPLRF
jgi:hypothetical protein